MRKVSEAIHKLPRPVISQNSRLPTGIRATKATSTIYLSISLSIYLYIYIYPFASKRRLECLRVCRAAASGCMLGHATSMLVLVRLYACQIRQPQIPIREPSRSSPCGTYVLRQPFRIFETCTEHIRGTSSQKTEAAQKHSNGNLPMHMC